MAAVERKITIEWEKLRVEREVVGRKKRKGGKEKEIYSAVAEVILAGNKMNTMNDTFFRQIYQVFQLLDSDPTVHCIILWSDRRVFSAGLDLQEAATTIGQSKEGDEEDEDEDEDEEEKAEQKEGGDEKEKSKKEKEEKEGEKAATDRARELYHVVKEWQKYISVIRENKKPVIVACHSAVIGGAIDLITAADIRLCSADATFAIAETKLGIVADLGTLQRISAIVGPGPARLLAFSAQPIDAPTALQLRLVNGVYPDTAATLLAARSLAAQIAALSPRAVQGTKVVLNYADQHSLEDSLNQVALFNACFLDPLDVAESIASFVEKRPPHYRPLSRL